MALALGSVLGGCMVPTEAEYVPTVNVWPRLKTTPSPTPSETVFQACNGGQRDYLGIYVVDPDARETLYWRVFIDNQPGRDNWVTDGSAPNRSPYVQIPSFTTYLTSFASPATQNPPPTHVVELFVSDREFTDPNEGRAVPDDAGTLSVTWAVDIISPCGGPK